MCNLTIASEYRLVTATGFTMKLFLAVSAIVYLVLYQLSSN